MEAFKSTLEEARYADLILHVVDSASPQMETQMEVVYETLQELGITGKRVITLFNKRDLAKDMELPKDLKASRILRISAASGEGLSELRELLEETLLESCVLVEKVYPYAQAGDIARVRRYGQIIEEEYRRTGSISGITRLPGMLEERSSPGTQELDYPEGLRYIYFMMVIIPRRISI